MEISSNPPLTPEIANPSVGATQQTPGMLTLMMSTLQKQADDQEVVVRDWADTVNNDNAKIQSLIYAENAIGYLLINLPSDNATVDLSKYYINPNTGELWIPDENGDDGAEPLPPEDITVEAYLEKLGVPIPGNDSIVTKDELKTISASIDSSLDTLTNQSQQDLIDFQTAMNEWKLLYETMSNLTTKYFQITQSAVSNM